MGLVIQELEKIETQHGDNETTIKRHGGALGERLDDGLSAWKLGVRRPASRSSSNAPTAGSARGSQDCGAAGDAA
jgi:hypothetical protein